jgi:hypothetical protein
MSNVKVWNDSENDYREEFKGREIYIRANDYIEMPRAEAVTFQGTYTPARRNGTGRFLNEKRIRLEFDLEADAKRKDQPIKYTCEVTGEQFRTEDGWNKHQAELTATARPAQSEAKNVKKATGSKPAGRSKQPIL